MTTPGLPLARLLPRKNTPLSSRKSLRAPMAPRRRPKRRSPSLQSPRFAPFQAWAAEDRLRAHCTASSIAVLTCSAVQGQSTRSEPRSPMSGHKLSASSLRAEIQLQEAELGEVCGSSKRERTPDHDTLAAFYVVDLVLESHGCCVLQFAQQLCGLRALAHAGDGGVLRAAAAVAGLACPQRPHDA
eukprot:3761999-Rhodomonas_salina.2